MAEKLCISHFMSLDGCPGYHLVGVCTTVQLEVCRIPDVWSRCGGEFSQPKLDSGICRTRRTQRSSLTVIPSLDTVCELKNRCIYRGCRDVSCQVTARSRVGGATWRCDRTGTLSACTQGLRVCTRHASAMDCGPRESMSGLTTICFPIIYFAAGSIIA